MKKVLILAYDFPLNNSAGSLRPYSWFKYLKEFDIYPVVVTRHWDENIRKPVDTIRATSRKTVELEDLEQGTIIRVPYKPNLSNKILIKFGENKFAVIRKLVTFLFLILKYPFPIFDATKDIHKEAERYLAKNICDVIIATAEPFILFKYASKLSRKYGIPWIADYRDGWSTNSFVNTQNPSGWFKQLIQTNYFRFLERMYVNRALMITTTNNLAKKYLENLHKNKSVFVIYNGYDFEISRVIDQSKSCFQIAFSGSLYPIDPLELFLEGYRSFIKKTSCERSRVIFYGSNFYSEQKKRIYAFDHDLRNNIITTERLPFEQLVSGLQEASVLLLLAEREMGNIHVKLFEYLALDRFILMVKNDFGPMEKIMKDCNGGIICSTANEVEMALSNLYAEYLSKGLVEHKSNNFEIYSRRNQTKSLAKLLLRVADNLVE